MNMDVGYADTPRRLFGLSWGVVAPVDGNRFIERLAWVTGDYAFTKRALSLPGFSLIWITTKRL